MTAPKASITHSAPSPFDPIEDGPRDLGQDPLGPGPIDTIREALALQRSIHLSSEAQTERSVTALDTALAALTEVEHQLEAGLPILSIDGRYVLTSKWAKEQARAVAAETALADYRDDFQAVMDEACAGDERHCTCVPHLRTALAEANQRADYWKSMVDTFAEAVADAADARAALDRHTQETTT